MGLIPDEEIKKTASMSLAPMVDFLFVVVAVFATLAMTRTFLYDRDIKLVKASADSTSSFNEEPYIVHIGITEEGKYKWLTEVSDFLVENVLSLQKELQKQQEMGLLSKDPEKTKILLHIDRSAKWEPIAELIFALKEQGFKAHPVYEP